jgi:hypothetical protein
MAEWTSTAPRGCTWYVNALHTLNSTEQCRIRVLNASFMSVRCVCICAGVSRTHSRHVLVSAGHNLTKLLNPHATPPHRNDFMMACTP